MSAMHDGHRPHKFPRLADGSFIDDEVLSWRCAACGAWVDETSDRDLASVFFPVAWPDGWQRCRVCNVPLSREMACAWLEDGRPFAYCKTHCVYCGSAA